VTRARRERELARLVHQQPGGTDAVFAMLLGIPLQQATAALLSLQVKGLIEPAGVGGWARRYSEVRSWKREPPSHTDTENEP
jgi:hypothetical protein